MSELIPIVFFRIGSTDMESVDARILHANLGVNRQYADWIRTWVKKAHLVEHRDYEVFHTDVKNPTGGRPSAEYALTLDAAKCIAMMCGTPKGDEVRAYFLAREQEAITLEKHAHPQVKNPANQLLIDAVVRIDTLEQEQQRQHDLMLTQQATLIASQAQAITALQQSARAETKADLALEDAHRMTIEEFICKNGYFRTFPPSQWPGIASWLKPFCCDYNLRPEKTPTPGKHWPDELSYPIRALAAWLEYELHKPRQIHLVETPREGA